MDANGEKRKEPKESSSVMNRGGEFERAQKEFGTTRIN
jgi:hypothetical protein